MSIISAGDTGAADLPEIANSLRFDGTNGYLSRTFGTPTNTNVWSYSAWVKRGKLSGGTTMVVFDASSTPIYFEGDDRINVYPTYTTYYARDPSAHFHLLAVSNGTTFYLYANGVQIYTSGTIPAGMNTSGVHYLGARGGSQCLEGYLSNVCFIDGAAKQPSDFAYTDPNGQWRSLSRAALTSLASAGGTNSFFLPFDNGSSTTTLGYDASSKGNNWTLNNMVRDGSVNDCWSYDTPTNNFAVMSPIATEATYRSITQGALKFQGTSGTAGAAALSTFGMSSGKWYWEVTSGQVANISYPIIGIEPDNGIWISSSAVYNYCYGYSATSGQKVSNNTFSAYGATYTTNDVIGVAFNADDGTLTFYKNGVSQGVAFTGLSGKFFPFTMAFTTGGTGIAYMNHGQLPVSGGAFDSASGGYFRYTPPSGFKALCTKNLPTTGSVTTSGSFTGNAAADGPFVWLNGTPTAMTIDGNAVTWGTHADKLANGFKIRTASSPYNDATSNSYTVTTNDGVFKYNNAEKNP